MKRIGYALILFCLVAGLHAQQEPRIRASGENFTYAALAVPGTLRSECRRSWPS